MERKEYVAPVIIVYGDVESITQASASQPNTLDGTYTNRPASDPIWSAS